MTLRRWINGPLDRSMKHKLQFTLSKLGIAWMFALVTINFNRVAIVELGVPAVLVALMIGLYPFFGPFQPLFRRLTQRYRVFGYGASAWLVIGMLAGALVFPFLPRVAVAIGAGSISALVLGFGLFFWFGAMIALMANTYLDLIAECVSDENRAGVFAMAWTGQTAIMVVWAFVFRTIMPSFDLAQMQTLYTLTPAIVLILALASVWKLEQPVHRRGAATAGAEGNKREKETDVLNSLQSSMMLLRGNTTAQAFFGYIVFCFLALFTQDLIQEVYAGEVFGLSVGQSVAFQQIFNATVTVGMGMTGALAGKRFGKAIPIHAKKRIANLGGAVAMVGFASLAIATALGQLGMVYPAFAIVGLGVGGFTFASVTMMSDMTVPGQTQNYLGLWSIAQAIGLGSSFILSGILHGLLVASHVFEMHIGYAVFFGLEGLVMGLCLVLLRPTSAERLIEGRRGRGVIQHA